MAEKAADPSASSPPDRGATASPAIGPAGGVPVNPEEEKEEDEGAAKGDEDDMDSEADDTRSKLENIKYYASLFLGTACIVCIFAFLFLVPFVLDPAISTLMHEFVDEPVMCKVSSIAIKKGKSNCTWSSCREGCTADMYKCFQVRVLYSRQKFRNGTSAAEMDEWGWMDLTRYDEKEDKVMQDTPLLVNIKGCGYPPEINCGEFATKYQNISDEGGTFPCYYSKVNPWMVLETYDFSESMSSVVASIAIPNGLFVISLGILLYWYCPYCQARCRKYEEQMDMHDDEREFEVDDPDEPQEPPF